MITLSAEGKDRLNHQLRLWREERLFHGKYWTVAMTQESIDGLEARINRLHENIASLNDEYRRIVGL